MKKNAISLVLIMIAGSFAGCMAGGNDGVPEISLSDEDISGLFDDYFMDFVNNSSVTVINEIHYHNNTTFVTNENNNITNNEGDSLTDNTYLTEYTNYSLGGFGNNSGNGDNIHYVMHLEFNASEIAPELVPRIYDDPRLRTFNYNKSFYGLVFVDGNGDNGTTGSNGSDGWYEERWIDITHEVDCSIYYHFEGEEVIEIDQWGTYEVFGDGTFWADSWPHSEPMNAYVYQDYWYSIYGFSSSDETSQMTFDDYYNAGLQYQDYCYPVHYEWVAFNYVSNVGQIDIPHGYIVTGTVVEVSHVYNNSHLHNNNPSIKFVRESGMITYNDILQYGGWENLTVMIDLHVQYLYEDSEFELTILYSFTPVIPVSLQ